MTQEPLPGQSAIRTLCVYDIKHHIPSRFGARTQNEGTTLASNPDVTEIARDFSVTSGLLAFASPPWSCRV